MYGRVNAVVVKATALAAEPSSAWVESSVVGGTAQPTTIAAAIAAHRRANIWIPLRLPGLGVPGRQGRFRWPGFVERVGITQHAVLHHPLDAQRVADVF